MNLVKILIQKIVSFSSSFKTFKKVCFSSTSTLFETFDYSHEAILRENLTEEICRYNFIPFPFNGKEAKNYLKRIVNEQKQGTGYYFILNDLMSLKFIGAIRILSIEPDKSSAEFGTWLIKSERGTGRNKEVKERLIDFAFRTLKLKKLYCYVMANNIASVEQFKKLNLSFDKKEKNHYQTSSGPVDRLTYYILNPYL